MFQEKTEVRGEMVGLRVGVSENKATGEYLISFNSLK